MVKNKRKNSKFFKFISNFFKFIVAIIYSLFRSVTIDLFKNIKYYFSLFTNKEKHDKIKDNLKLDKKQKLIEDRIERLERLVYAVYNDPSYTKRDQGLDDIKELKIKINK